MAELQFWTDFAKAGFLTLVAETGGGVFILAVVPNTFPVYSAVFLGCLFGLIPMTLISVEVGVLTSGLLSSLVGNYVPVLFYLLFAMYCFYFASQYREKDKGDYHQLPGYTQFERNLHSSWFPLLGNAIVTAMWLELCAKSQLGVMALASSLNYKPLLLGCGTAQVCILLLPLCLGNRALRINAKQRLISLTLGTIAITYGLLLVLGTFINSADDENGGPAIDPVSSKPT